MADSGIIRRVDELGRIVIPKEIRKNFRLYEGSTLSISVNKNNEIVLSKYSRVDSLYEYASVIVQILSNTLECVVLVCDMEKIVSSSKKGLANKALTEATICNFRSRKNYIFQKKDSMMPSIYDGDTSMYTSQGVLSIISDGDVVGGIIIYTTTDKDLTYDDIKICQVMASFLGDI